MLAMGKSRPWQDAFQNVTGYRELTAQPIKDYFEVLYNWMKEQRKKEGYSIGWETSSARNVGTSAFAFIICTIMALIFQ